MGAEGERRVGRYLTLNKDYALYQGMEGTATASKFLSEDVLRPH